MLNTNSYVSLGRYLCLTVVVPANNNSRRKKLPEMNHCRSAPLRRSQQSTTLTRHGKRSVMITQEMCPIRAEISTHKQLGKCIYLLFEWLAVIGFRQNYFYILPNFGDFGAKMSFFHLRNECLFFWVHGVWIVARDKQIAWTAKRFSGDLFVPRYDLYPMNPEKKTLIPYIYNVSNKNSF